MKVENALHWLARACLIYVSVGVVCGLLSWVIMPHENADVGLVWVVMMYMLWWPAMIWVLWKHG